MNRSMVSIAGPVFMGLVVTAEAGAQPLGTFTWQLQPYCNRVTVNVRQDGAVYTLDGTDDQCGAAQRAPVVGVAAVNPDGSIGFGLNIVAPSGQPVPVQARISVATLSGTWRDSGGNTGTFAFGGALPGLPRPVPTAPGDITEVTAGTGLTGGGLAGAVTVAVDPTVVQSRVTTACPAGQALRSILQNGTAVCEPITGSAGGDITAVTAGVGLTGGGDAGDVTLSVVYGGDGIAEAVARADHEHLHNASSVAIGTSALAGFGVNNVAIGFDALRFTNSGSNNTAIGYQAARSVTDTSAVTAVGSEAFRNTTALGNTGVGASAGRATTTGQLNTAVGHSALFTNQTGSHNVAVGRAALLFATTSNNTAVGAFALDAATIGTANTALGQRAFSNLTTGSSNTALGNEAGALLVTGSLNTLVGDNADVASGALSNATALGANAFVAQDNSLVLGSINGINGATADARVGIGTSTPDSTLDVARESSDITDGTNVMRTTYFGASNNNETFESLRARGTRAAPAPVLANDNLFTVSGGAYNGSAFASLKAFAVAEASQDWTTTANGTRWKFGTTPDGALNSVERLRIEHNGRVGIGTTTPDAVLHVNGTVHATGLLRLDALAAAGTTTLCRNLQTNEVAQCSSSLRYKEQVAPFASGLAVLKRFTPISFTWKGGGPPDVGFGAEDVAAIDPRFAVFNPDGTVEGVKYDRLTTVLVNAVKELEAQNADLRDRNEALERRLAAIEAALARLPE